MYKRIIYGLCLIALVTACRENYQDDYEEIVIEGWIESDGAPVVILTKTFTVTTREYVDEDENIVLPWGKVMVSDGIESVILTGGYDDRYFPPYIYTTSKMRGMPGRTYYLTVEYGNRKVTAQTTIPMPDSLESLTVSPCIDVDSMYQITAYYNDNPDTKDYYMFFTRVFNKETRYYPSFLGVVDDEHLTLYNQQVVQPGIHMLTDERHLYKPYYHKTDSVQVKFAKIDEVTYNIHKAYNEMVALSSNPVFHSDISMPTNIQGGFGFWCGYGVTKYNIVISDSIGDRR